MIRLARCLCPLLFSLRFFCMPSAYSSTSPLAFGDAHASQTALTASYGLSDCFRIWAALPPLMISGLPSQCFLARSISKATRSFTRSVIAICSCHFERLEGRLSESSTPSILFSSSSILFLSILVVTGNRSVSDLSVITHLLVRDSSDLLSQIG